MKVLFLTNIPSPYMVDFFNEFGKLCDLTVIFERSNSSERDKSWKEFNFINFKGRILSGLNIGVDGAFCPSIIKYLFKKEHDFIIIANPMTPTGIISIFFLKLLKRKYIIESEGGFAKDGKGFKEWLKKQIIKDAYAYFSTTDIGDEYFIAYGAERSNIYKYPFSSILESEIVNSSDLDSRRVNARKKIGIQYDNVILSVGSIIPRKGHDITIRALHLLNINNTGLYIVGGQASEELLALIKELDVKNVHFVDFIGKGEIQDYYSMADIFVLSTRYDTWGLVINEAMANGLPVITTDMCIAGTELIIDNVNGFVIPIEDYSLLFSRLDILLRDKELRVRLGQESLSKIKKYTINTMARTHLALLLNFQSQEL
ncbi:MAG TPA: hypothetical protein DIC19_05800 [Erysipelotrichaceae bacterium]|nr:hypothetical protein [Erysipelotrichaceae bacterium]